VDILHDRIWNRQYVRARITDPPIPPLDLLQWWPVIVAWDGTEVFHCAFLQLLVGGQSTQPICISASVHVSNWLLFMITVEWILNNCGEIFTLIHWSGPPFLPWCSFSKDSPSLLTSCEQWSGWHGCWHLSHMSLLTTHADSFCLTSLLRTSFIRIWDWHCVVLASTLGS